MGKCRLFLCLHCSLYWEMSLDLYVCIAHCMGKCRLTCMSALLIVWRNVACLVCLHCSLYGEMSLVLCLYRSLYGEMSLVLCLHRSLYGEMSLVLCLHRSLYGEMSLALFARSAPGQALSSVPNNSFVSPHTSDRFPVRQLHGSRRWEEGGG